MNYLITGGCGFLGANLASEVLLRGKKLTVFDNLSRAGTDQNLSWLQGKGLTDFVQGDISDRQAVDQLVARVKPDVVFHLAGQVAMTTSLENPRLDFETNVVGSHNLLEALRTHAPRAIVVYSSTNKVYGDLETITYEETPTRYRAPAYPQGFDETIGLDFRSPYGCSKGAADQYMLDYTRNFGVRTIVFRHSSIFGGRQFSTFDQGWVGWFVQQALLTKAGKLTEPFTIAGDGKQVRDVLFASDLIRCYFDAVAAIERCAGQAFNIGGGMQNSISLLELFALLEQKLAVRLTYKKLPWRANDQKIYVADIRKATEYFGWSPRIAKEDGMKEMIRWVQENH